MISNDCSLSWVKLFIHEIYIEPLMLYLLASKKCLRDLLLDFILMFQFLQFMPPQLHLVSMNFQYQPMVHVRIVVPMMSCISYWKRRTMIKSYQTYCRNWRKTGLPKSMSKVSFMVSLFSLIAPETIGSFLEKITLWI